MSGKVKVPWEIRLGQAGESAIKSCLAHFSTVTKLEPDPGIDFYCELVEDDSPTHIHFNVQAKGTEHFDDKWGAGIEKKTIRYWLEKPFPVFLIVYDDVSGNCYWMSIEDFRYRLLPEVLDMKTSTIYMTMDRSHLLERGKGKNAEFIAKIKNDLSSILQFRGYPQMKGEEYVKIIPAQPRSSVEFERIKENVRVSLYSLIHYWLLNNETESAYLCCSFLINFDNSHYNHFAWFGILNKELGRKTDAIKYLEQAVKMLEDDRNWPQGSKQKIIEALEQEIEKCR